MVRQPCRLASVGGDDVDIRVVIVCTSIGDHRSVRRKDGLTQDVRAGDEPMSLSAITVNNPDLSTILESDFCLGERGEPQEQQLACGCVYRPIRFYAVHYATRVDRLAEQQTQKGHLTEQEISFHIVLL